MLAYKVVDNNPGPEFRTQHSLAHQNVMAEYVKTGFWLALKPRQCTRMPMKWVPLLLLAFASIRSVTSELPGAA